MDIYYRAHYNDKDDGHSWTYRGHDDATYKGSRSYDSWFRWDRSYNSNDRIYSFFYKSKQSNYLNGEKYTKNVTKIIDYRHRLCNHYYFFIYLYD